MKRKNDPRHLKRAKIVKQLFSFGFSQPLKASRNISAIVSSLPQIDRLIASSAPDRPIEQINRIDLAILRLAVFELIIKKDAPYKVVVDEAVELGKEYGSASSAAFVNGVLGKLIELEGIAHADQL